jgi:hypothetical protein
MQSESHGNISAGLQNYCGLIKPDIFARIWQNAAPDDLISSDCHNPGVD